MCQVSTIWGRFLQARVWVVSGVETCQEDRVGISAINHRSKRKLCHGSSLNALSHPPRRNLRPQDTRNNIVIRKAADICPSLQTDHNVKPALLSEAPPRGALWQTHCYRNNRDWPSWPREGLRDWWDGPIRTDPSGSHIFQHPRQRRELSGSEAHHEEFYTKAGRLTESCSS